ncbi:MAG: POTRA domain-containing protein, partial [Desulfuromonadales bacterium]
MMHRPFKIALLAITIISSNAFAADVPDAGRLLRESSPPPSLKPQIELPIITKPPEKQEPVPSGPKVKVSGFVFVGNTVLSSEVLSAALDRYIGKDLTLAELDDAAAQITSAYRARGYFLASAHIPPQTIKPDAPIRIEIIEGLLEGVRLQTTPAETRTPHTLLQRYIERVPVGRPAEEGALSEMVMRINELPGISSRILLEPGSVLGTTKALLDVKEGIPYGFSIDTDNHGSYSTGYYRIGYSLELYSPLHMGDLFTLRMQPSFSNNSQTVQTGYSLPVSTIGTKLGFNYSYVTYKLG